MEISFCSSGINNYLSVRLLAAEADRGTLKYQVSMLENNQIDGLLPVTVTEQDDDYIFKYNITGAYIVDRLAIRKKPNGDYLRRIMSGICECVSSLDKYFLDVDGILLEPEYMFQTAENDGLLLAYVAGAGLSFKGQLKDFLEYIMRSFDYRDKEGMEYLYQLYDEVAGDGFNLAALCSRFTEEKKQESACKVENTFNATTAVNTPAEAGRVYESAGNSEANKIAGAAKQSLEEEPVQTERAANKNIIRTILMVLNFLAAAFFVVHMMLKGRNTLELMLCIGLTLALFIQIILYSGGEEEDVEQIMEEYMETVQVQKPSLKADCEYVENIAQQNEKYNIRAAEAVSIHKLVPLKNGCLKPIELYEDEIIIGRGKEETNYRLATTQISRVHACIHNRTNKISVEDKTSTNGTFVNYVRIPPLVEVDVKTGDVISFADEEFYVV